MLSSKFNVLSHKSIPGGWIWNIPSERGVVFEMIILSTTTLCYLENWTFCPLFLFISILIALYLHRPYISLFKCNFGSLEWQFGMYCFYVDLETFSKIKLICVPTQYYWSIPFPGANSVFLSFSCVCRIYVSEVLIMHFCNYYHLRFVSPYEYKIEVNFLGVNSGSWSSSRSIFGLYILVWIFIVLILCQPYVIFEIQHFVP